MASDIEIIFLGTNGWYCTDTGHTVSILVNTPNSYILLDAGNGIFKAGNHIHEDKPVYLFLSHLHIDHISGLHILNKFVLPSGLMLCGYRGFKQSLAGILNQPFTLPVEALPYQVTFREMDPGRQSGFPFEIEAQELVHPSRCYGYRFEIGAITIAYCTDTGICNNLISLSRNADVLIAECGAITNGDTAWPHLTPDTAARAARDAEVSQLVLTHFAANLYPLIKDRYWAQKRAREVFQNTVAAYDDLIIKV